MSFCSECGNKLPENAVFCPNCGKRRTYPETNGNDFSYTASTNEPGAKYKSEPDVQYAAPYGLGSDIYKETAPGAPKNSSSKVAVIVICSVIALIIAAAALIYAFFDRDDPFLGRWNSVEIRYDDSATFDEIYDQPVNGLFEVELAEDGEIDFTSNYAKQSISGTWRENGSSIIAIFDNEQMYFSYDSSSDELSLYYDTGVNVVFERASEESAPSPSVQTGMNIAGSGDVGEYYVAIVGAEQFADIDNEYGVRFYYDFTNNSDADAYAYGVFNFEAKQNGRSVSETYTWNDADVYGNDTLYIRPGVTIRCCMEYKYDPDGGSIDFTISNAESGKSVTATYLADALPGAPLPFTAESYADPQWTLALPAQGDLDEYTASVTGAELTTDYYNNEAIRVFYEFTNNGDTEISMNDALYTCCFQDGIELKYTSNIIGSQSDDDFFSEVAPGSTVTASCVFILRSDSSPVEAEIKSYSGAGAVGQTYPIA